jgi:SAM-dependent methyltransferase
MHRHETKDYEGMCTMGLATIATREQLKEGVRREWSDPVTVAGWRRWFPKMLAQFQAGTDVLLSAASLSEGLRVLDLASGSGDPAIALAGAVGCAGQVVATDSSHDMLALAEENCRDRGLENVSFQLADAQDLPFPDESFDRVTSKLGVMYFVDCTQALGEIRRVLKPGGRIALLAWGRPDISPYIQAGLGPALERAQLPPPPAGAPQPFRFAEPGSLSAELKLAGFQQIEEETHVVPLAWPGPPEEVWEHLYAIAAPFRPIIDGLRPEDREWVIGETLTRLRGYYVDGFTITPAAIVVASATR